MLLLHAVSHVGFGSLLMASASHASAHNLQFLQYSVTPNSIGESFIRGRSVKTLHSLTLDPYSGVTSSPFLPSWPRPASIASGTLKAVSFPAGTAVYPRFLINSAREEARNAIFE